MTYQRALIVVAFGSLLNVPSASAQTAVVELVRGTVSNIGTKDKPTNAVLEQGDRLVVGTRIRVGHNDRVVLIQERALPGDSHARRSCVTWTIIGGVSPFTVGNVPGSCQPTLNSVRIADDTTNTPFVQRIVFVEFQSDRADLAEPPMLTRLRASTDTLREVGTRPDVDLAVNFSLEGPAAGPLFLTGEIVNKSKYYYPCVQARFFLGMDGPDGAVVKVGSLTTAGVRRLRPRETRSFKQPFAGKNSVWLDSVTTC